MNIHKHIIFDLKQLDKKRSTCFDFLIYVEKNPAQRYPAGYLHKTGILAIGEDFSERFYCAIGFWKLKDYYHQWHEGFQRLKIYDRSCIINSIYKTGDNELSVEWWMLYRQGNKVYIYNQHTSNQYLIEDTVFGVDTCYDFMPDKPIRKLIKDDDGKEDWNISEWVLDYDADIR